jgi:GTPase SAR1 family protein
MRNSGDKIYLAKNFLFQYNNDEHNENATLSTSSRSTTGIHPLIDQDPSLFNELQKIPKEFLKHGLNDFHFLLRFHTIGDRQIGKTNFLQRLVHKHVFQQQEKSDNSQGSMIAQQSEFVVFNCYLINPLAYPTFGESETDNCHTQLAAADIATKKQSESLSVVDDERCGKSIETETSHPSSLHLRLLKIRCQLFDTIPRGDVGSHEVLKFFRNCHGVFLCYDVTNRSSFDNLSRWLTMIQDSFVYFEGVSSKLQRVIVLIGMKQDLDSTSMERRVSYEEGQVFAKEHHLHAFIETSSRDDVHVQDALATIVCHFLSNNPKLTSTEAKVKESRNSKSKTNSHGHTVCRMF